MDPDALKLLVWSLIFTFGGVGTLYVIGLLASFLN